MKRISRYFDFLRDNRRRIFYKDIHYIYPKENVAKKLVEGEENIYSPEILEYMIKNHIRELEYTYLSENRVNQIIVPKIKEKKGPSPYVFLSRIDFLNAVESAFKNGEISFLTYQKTKYLRYRSTFESFLEDINDKEYIFKRSDKEKVAIPIKTMVDILMLPQEEIEEILEKKPFGLSKQEFVYSILAVFKLDQNHKRYINLSERMQMFKKYYFPSQLVQNVHELEKTVDTTLIEKPIQEEPKYVSYIHVNPEIWNTITSKIPTDFNNLEKAYYIYYQLCKTFTYSEHYFRWGETRKETMIGIIKKIEDLERKTKVNNHVVCYEIMGIYQAFLKDMGVKFDHADDNFNRNRNVSYKNHPVVNINIDDEFLIEADATRSVITGDMPLAKENRPLKGFLCTNQNEDTQKRFAASIEKVNKYIAQTEELETSFFDVVNAYKDSLEGEDILTLTDQEKLSILVNSITQTELSETDRLVYVNELTKNLFPSGNCDNYFVINHGEGYKGGKYTNGIPELTIIFSYYAENDPTQEKTYYSYSTKDGLQVRTHDELQEEFNNERYEYMIRYQKEIPNIEIKKSEGDKYAI